MGNYNIVNAPSLAAGQPEDVGQVLANFQAIQAVLNGGIDDVNIRSTAAINPSKLLGYPTDPTKVLFGDGVWGSMTPTRQIFTAAGAGTYTTPARCLAILVECTGAGGGGGGVPAASSGIGSAAGSGGGGAYAAKLIAAPAATYALIVGSGGNGGPAGSNAGGAGVDTNFGAGLVVAKGAAGGGAGVAAIVSGAIEGSAGGAGSLGAGDITADGGKAAGSIWSTTAPIFGTIGAAGNGAGPYGGGMGGGRTAGASVGNVGFAGKLYGGGGTGALALGAGAPAAAGGAGAPGLIVVTEFY